MTKIGVEIKAGVIAWPGKHSLSPKLHGYWLNKYNIRGSYELLSVPPQKFRKTLQELGRSGYVGVNITIPHKEAALLGADKIDKVAERVGAANTINVSKNGLLSATNTDVYGFLKQLKVKAPDWKGGSGPAVVLGAGGAARAVCFALLQEGVSEIRLINRTEEKAIVLQNYFGSSIVVEKWRDKEKAFDGANILVNTTSLGMLGMDELKLRLSRLPRTAIVYDLVYNPLETDLLKLAKDNGNLVVDGLGMLFFQAQPCFSAWFGVEPSITEDLYAFIMERNKI